MSETFARKLFRVSHGWPVLALPDLDRDNQTTLVMTRRLEL